MGQCMPRYTYPLTTWATLEPRLSRYLLGAIAYPSTSTSGLYCVFDIWIDHETSNQNMQTLEAGYINLFESFNYGSGICNTQFDSPSVAGGFGINASSFRSPNEVSPGPISIQISPSSVSTMSHSGIYGYMHHLNPI